MGRSLWATWIVLLVATPLLAQTKTWQYSGGKWVEAPQATTRPSPQLIPNKTLDKAEALLDARRARQAHDIILSWLKSNPNTPDHDRAIYLLAEAYFQLGDRIWCFYEADELLEKYPDSRLYFLALDLQYRVADSFLNGFKKRFLGFPIVSMEDEAIEMLFRIQERSPGSPVAERSLLRTADYYYHTSQFDLAADAYGAYARAFPRSPEVPRIRLQQAFSYMAQFRGPKYDATPLIDARALLRDISERYPDLARNENLSQFIERIDSTLATKMYWTADYYARTHQPRAAVFVYRSLINSYPTSRDAELARRRLPQMPAYALAQPDAPPAVLDTPSTQPGGEPPPVKIPMPGDEGVR